MAYMNMAAASQALKQYYLPGIQYQMNTANPILAVVERDSTSVQGDNVVMALRYGRQGGVGNRADDGALPTPNSRKTKQATWNTKNMFARIQVSDKTMRASRSREGAFLDLLQADLEDAMADAKDSLARQVFGDGTGTLATTAVNNAVGTLLVSSVQYLVEGQVIDITDSTGVTVKYGPLFITAVDDAALTITVTTANGGAVAATTLATDLVVVNGSYGLELTGFGKVFTPDNTLYGVNRATNKWFNPTIKNLAGNISEVAIQKQNDEVDRKAGSKTNFLLSSYGVRRAYQNLLLATKQIVDVMKLEGGYEALNYNGMPFTVDKYAPDGTLFGLDLTTWRMYELMDFDWLEEDGAVLSRVSGFAVWEAILAKYADLGCSKPRGNWKMTGITEM